MPFLEEPDYEECSECQGDGWIAGGDGSECPRCEGTGDEYVGSD